FQAEDGIRDRNVTGVQTCALPISTRTILFPGLSWRVRSLIGKCQVPGRSQREVRAGKLAFALARRPRGGLLALLARLPFTERVGPDVAGAAPTPGEILGRAGQRSPVAREIGRASCRERV